MGVARTICSALMGPIVVWVLLMAHVGYRVFLETPEAVSVQDWPKDTPKEVVDATVALRKPLIREVMDAFANRMDDTDAFVARRLTADAEFEDPSQRWQGEEEMRLLFGTMSKMIKSIEYEVHGEYHGPHEIVMDWTLKCTFKMLPNFPLPPMRMRSHFLLEPPASPSEPEKIFRMHDEWNGTRQLNEKTTVAMLGKVHARLRRFVGYLFSSAARKGWV